MVLFAGDKVYGVDGNNGIVAYKVVLPGGPPLSITLSRPNAILSWDAPSTGFVLQKNLTLSPAGWSDVSQTPMVVNGKNTVSESAATGKAFYRLHKP